MDPYSVVTSLFTIAQDLIAIAGKVQKNREQCKRLGKHVGEIIQIIQVGCKKGVPDDLEARLVELFHAMQRLMDTLKEMNTQTLFKKVILRDNVSERIEEAYKALSEAIQLCEIGMSIDMRRVTREHEDARRIDHEVVLEKLEQVQLTSNEILSKLHHLDHGSAERLLLGKCLHQMQTTTCNHPKTTSGVLLPASWDERRTPEGRKYYDDHNTRQTTWSYPEPACTGTLPGGPEERRMPEPQHHYVDPQRSQFERIRKSSWDW